MNQPGVRNRKTIKKQNFGIQQINQRKMAQSDKGLH